MLASMMIPIMFKNTIKRTAKKEHNVSENDESPDVGGGG